jgi:hypothetical protein
MAALIFLFLNLVASLFKSKSRRLCWFLPLLALEISESGRPAANQCGFAGIDPADER